MLAIPKREGEGHEHGEDGEVRVPLSEEVVWGGCGDAWGSPAYKDEHVYTCPLCGEELEEVA
jgi:hypothetical protein